MTEEKIADSVEVAIETQLNETAVKAHELPPPSIVIAETRVVPVELNNVNLKIELRTPISVADNFQHTQDIIGKLREQFGDNALIEQLSQIVWGTIEKVTISLPQPTVAPVASAPAQATQPVPVSIPQTNNDIANYKIQSTQCPWTGNSLKMLDPASIYKVLYESAQHRALMTAQDITMLEAYYAQWYREETAKRDSIAHPLPLEFDGDSIPF